MTEYDLAKMGENLYSMQDAVEILKRLTSPDGCPWDREQTHDTIRTNMIEEAYEAVDAIDNREPGRLKDELGDVLLQVLLHAAISENNGGFSLLDITDNLCRKLISRHSHVFGTDVARTGEDGLDIWNQNKMKEKKLEKYSETLTDIPRGHPALLRAEKIQKRAAKSGFDWDDARGALEKVQEEIAEIKGVLESADQLPPERVDPIKTPELFSELEEEVGDFLFACVNYSRLLGIAPEVALNRSNEKFVRRFCLMETLAEKEGKDFAALSLEEKEDLWVRVKMDETQSSA